LTRFVPAPRRAILRVGFDLEPNVRVHALRFPTLEIVKASGSVGASTIVRCPPMAGIYCGPLDLTEVHMSDRNKARVGEFLDRVLTGGDIEATGDYFERDMVEEMPFPGQGPGLDGLKETLIRIRSAFPDSNWTVEEQIAEGDKVLSRFVWSGTHQGEFLGIPATHRPIRVWGMVIDRFAGEKIVSTRILMDTFGMMMQLGVISNPAQQAK
jgi:predicted ester cyclase